MWGLTEAHATSAGHVAAGRSGAGRPVVLAHGWPWSSYAWHRVIPLLARRFHVHWYDMPGFGRSEKGGPRPASLDVQGEVFAEMLAAWGLEAPAVVAHDFGGAVALRAHLLHGVDFNRLILMNVVALRPWGSGFFAHVGRHVEAFRGVPPHIHAAIARAYIESAGALPAEEVDALLPPWLGPVGQQAFYDQFALADEALTAAFEPHLAALRCPAAVLWGTEDPWIPLARGTDLAQRLGVPLERLEGLGHLPQLEAPEAVAPRLLARLER